MASKKPRLPFGARLGIFGDRLLSVIAPRAALHRMAARATMAQLSDVVGYSGGLYTAGNVNLQNGQFPKKNLSENSNPADNTAKVAADAWFAWRNTPQGRKIDRSLRAKILGTGLIPQNQAVDAEGKPADAFRTRAQRLFEASSACLDFRGKPGEGGQTFNGLQQSALKQVLLTGELLIQFKWLNADEQKRLKLPIPLQIQLIRAERLDSSKDNLFMGGWKEDEKRYFRGIEFDAEGRRVAYHILNENPDESISSESTRVPADQIIHLYQHDDVDQYRGVSAFAAAVERLQHAGDYEYNELIAAKLSACFMLSVNAPGGGTIPIAGTNTTTGVKDTAGNSVTAMSPGMIFSGVEVNAINPSRPNADAPGWLDYIARSTSCAFPMKPTSLTGDFRGSSFSSEKASDNDIWPEIEPMQEWFATHFCAPIYRAVIVAGYLHGYFDDVIPPGGKLLPNATEATWQGPIPRSINPKDDAIAASLRVASGQSSPQMEAARANVDWRKVVEDNAEYIAFAEEKGLPEWKIKQTLAMGDSTLSAYAKASQADDTSDDSGD